MSGFEDPGLNVLVPRLCALVTDDEIADYAVRRALAHAYDTGVSIDTVLRMGALYMSDFESGAARTRGITPEFITRATEIYFDSGPHILEDVALSDVDLDFIKGVLCDENPSWCTCAGHIHDPSAASMVIMSTRTEICVHRSVASFINEYVAIMCIAEDLIYGKPLPSKEPPASPKRRKISKTPPSAPHKVTTGTQTDDAWYGGICGLEPPGMYTGLVY
jgi:hypothetical protein